MLQYTVQKT